MYRTPLLALALLGSTLAHGTIPKAAEANTPSEPEACFVLAYLRIEGEDPQTIHILGQNFGNNPKAVVVKINGKTTRCVLDNANRIRIVLPLLIHERARLEVFKNGSRIIALNGDRVAKILTISEPRSLLLADCDDPYGYSYNALIRRAFHLGAATPLAWEGPMIYFAARLSDQGPREVALIGEGFGPPANEIKVMVNGRNAPFERHNDCRITVTWPQDTPFVGGRVHLTSNGLQSGYFLDQGPLVYRFPTEILLWADGDTTIDHFNSLVCQAFDLDPELTSATVLGRRSPGPASAW
jgi:hypothetical protein